MRKSITPAYILRKKKKSGAPAFSKQRIHLAAMQLGRQGGLVGGHARAEAIGSDRTRSIAVHAACARWGVPCHCDDCK